MPIETARPAAAAEIDASSMTDAAIRAMPINDLRRACKTARLKAGGSRAALADRLIAWRLGGLDAPVHGATLCPMCHGRARRYAGDRARRYYRCGACGYRFRRVTPERHP